MTRRVVFDTSTVVSALVFGDGRLAWLRQHWQEVRALPLISRRTTEELVRVLGYLKFALSAADRRELLAEYLPYCEVIEPEKKCAIICRDANDQPFLDLAHSGCADLLVTGDSDLLALHGRTEFLIVTAEAYRQNVSADR